MSTERVIVDSSISKEFEAALREAAGSIHSKRFDLVRKGAVEDLKNTVKEAIQAVSLDVCRFGRTVWLTMGCRALDISFLNPYTTKRPHHL